MLKKFYPEQAGSIEWVYDEVEKVHATEYSSADIISSAVTCLLVRPVEPARVKTNLEGQSREILNPLAIAPIPPAHQKLTFRSIYYSQQFYKELCIKEDNA